MATITVRPLIEFETWPVGISQAATPANWNALRAEVIARPAVGFQASQPGSPLDGDLYVLSGDWGNTYFDLDNNEITNPAGLLAYFREGAWSFWLPFDGQMKQIGGSYYEYSVGSESDWEAFNPGAAVVSVNGRVGAVVVLAPIGIAVGDETSDLTTGAGKVGFRMPYAMTLTEVRASVRDAPTGDDLIVDINKNGSTILSAKLQIDDGDTTSTTSSAPAVISDASLADDDEITIDIDQIGSSNAGAGLKVWLIGYAP